MDVTAVAVMILNVTFTGVTPVVIMYSAVPKGEALFAVFVSASY